MKSFWRWQNAGRHCDPSDASEMDSLAVRDEPFKEPISDTVPLDNHAIGFTDSSVRTDTRVHNLWTPLFLRRSALASFLIIYVITFIALAILFVYSQRNQGLSVADSDRYYAWTYGPTAVLTVVAAFWGQVEYRVKQMTPWKLMAERPQTVDRSLLLDYISPSIFHDLCRSLLQSDFAVTAVIISSLLIKAMIVLSTGLITLIVTPIVNKNASLVASDQLDREVEVPLTVNAGPVSAVWRVYKYNATYPLGTTERFAFQSFNTSTSSNSTLTGVVDVFSADLDCELAKVSSMDDTFYDINGNTINLTISTSSCNGLSHQLPSGTFQYLDLDYCANLGEDNFEAYHFALVTGLATQEQVGVITNSTDSSNGRPIYTTHLESTSIICKPSYAIRRASISLNPDSATGNVTPSVVTLPNSQPSSLPNVSAWHVAQAFMDSLDAAHPVFNSNNLWQNCILLLNASMSQEELIKFGDGRILEDALRRTYQSVTAQIAKSFLMKPSEDQFTGTSITDESRIFVRGVSFFLIESVLMLLILSTAYIYTLSPTMNASRDPSSIGGLATILARSPDITQRLEGLGASGLGLLRHRLLDCQIKVHTNDRPAFSIESSAAAAAELKDVDPNRSGHIEWYQPFGVSGIARVLILGVTLLLVAILETLYQISRSHDGIAELSSIDKYSHYAWTSLPALIMVGMGLLYAMVEFNIKIFQPYHVLRIGSAPAVLSILENHLQLIGLYALWTAARKRQVTVVAVLIATVLTPLLPIVVSGLYTVAPSPQMTAIDIRPLDKFELNSVFFKNGTEDAPEIAGMAAASMILAANLTYPSGTFDDLAFQTIDYTPSASRHPGTESRLRVRMPAFRGVANCTVLPSEHMMRQTCSDPQNLYYIPDENETFHESMNVRFSGDGYFGIAFDSANSGDNRWNYTREHPDCPRDVAGFGRVSGNVTREVTVLLCNPYVEQVEVDFTFIMPGYAIDTLEPPLPDSATATVFHNLSLVDFYGYDGLTNPVVEGANEAYDSFWSLVVHGKDGVPAAELCGVANVPKLLNAFERIYGRILAQVLNHERVAVNTTLPAGSTMFKGALENPNRLRLKQNALSTRILEGLLAVMFICATITFWTMDTRRVLPKNPCSIAAVASLLAGSEMLGKQVIPEGSEWCDDAELRENGVFESWLFSMGWWDDGDNGKMFRIDVGTAEKAS